MKPNPKISAAVAAILGASGTATVFAAPGDAATATATTGELAEVTVTAERRTENLQDVPITVQAITGEQLQQLNVTNFNDLLKYTPNVTYSGNGPGTGNIFMRGLGGTGSGNQSQSTTAPFPNVGLYLDDQSMQFPARNNDPYVVDLERIEILEGPQGTLFGGGAQAGAIRYITNKPKLDVTSGEVNAGYGITANGGDPNTQLNAVLNLPLIANTLAVRAVIFSERQGGYIDNVPGTIEFLPNSFGVEKGGNPIAGNAAMVENNTNPIDYQGFRVSLLWKINEDWNFLIQQNYQNVEADGYFYAYPNAPNNANTPLQQYQITAFTPAWNKDRYESTAWTLNGHFLGLDAVYTGSYMVRHIDGQQDYSSYMRSTFGAYYGCIGPDAQFFNAAHYPQLAGTKDTCYAPVGSWRDIVQNQHHSEELRLSTDQSYRLRGLFGAFWEKFVIDDQMDFNYLSIPQCDSANLAAAQAPGGPVCLSAIGPVPAAFGARATDPSLRENSNTAFGEDAQRGYKQTAFFASIDFDLIPKTLTLTGGGRWYQYHEFEEGSEFYNETHSAVAVANLINRPNGSCTNNGGCGFPINLDKTETGTRWRGDLTWHITPDIMTYLTYSQGFRPGGFNRTSSLVGGQPSLAAEVPYASPPNNTYQYLKPAGWGSDSLTNYEGGFKSEMFEHHLLFNASVYYMNWNHVQLSLFDPPLFGNTTFTVNGPNFIVKGFEVQFVARITDGLSLQGSTSVNSSSQTNAVCLESVGKVAGQPKTANNPVPAGSCITQINGAPQPNSLGAFGSAPAFSPPFMFNVRARYDWAASTYHWFTWVGASHISGMNNNPANYKSGTSAAESPPTGWPDTTMLLYQIPGYTTYDGALGVSKDNWTAQIMGTNLSDEYGPSNVTSGQFIKAEIPLRPRVLSFLMSYRF
jgi:iron complex outermembrane recepter protein